MKSHKVWVYINKRINLKYEPLVTPMFGETNKGNSAAAER